MMRQTLWIGLLCAGLGSAQAADLPVFKVGVLTDLSGLYADLSGPGSVAAARMALADFKPEEHGFRVEILQGDHLNKPDVGSTIAQRWLGEDGVDVIADVPTSSVALAVATIVQQRNKVFLIASAGTSDLTGKACTPNNVHWTLLGPERRHARLDQAVHHAHRWTLSDHGSGGGLCVRHALDEGGRCDGQDAGAGRSGRG